LLEEPHELANRFLPCRCCIHRRYRRRRCFPSEGEKVRGFDFVQLKSAGDRLKDFGRDIEWAPLLDPGVVGRRDSGKSANLFAPEAGRTPPSAPMGKTAGFRE
jgi:hypothetical protein